MPSWTHLVRFVAVEDSQVHLGQLVDTTRDVGLDSANGLKIAVFVIEGTIFDGRVTKEIMHVKQVSFRALFSPFKYTIFTNSDSYYPLSHNKSAATFVAWVSIIWITQRYVLLPPHICVAPKSLPYHIVAP